MTFLHHFCLWTASTLLVSFLLYSVYELFKRICCPNHNDFEDGDVDMFDNVVQILRETQDEGLRSRRRQRHHVEIELEEGLQERLQRQHRQESDHPDGDGLDLEAGNASDELE